MASVQRLECGLSVHVDALIPQLQSHFLSVNIEDLEAEVGESPGFGFLPMGKHALIRLNHLVHARICG